MMLSSKYFGTLFFRIFFLCLFLCYPTASYPAADQDNAKSRFVKVPLLYMTDRALSDNGFLNKRKHERNSIYEVYCGSLEYTLANTENKIINDQRAKLGWVTESNKPKYPVEKITLDGSADSHTSYEGFDKAIIQTVKRTGAKEVFIYLHGFNNPFNGAARSAARLAYYSECPVILYSWPSAAKVLQYYTDLGNNEWSQEHFNRLLEELLKLKEETGIKFSLCAHSMGIKLAVRGAPVVKGKQLFENIFLINPDLDARTFVHYVSRFMAENQISKPADSDTAWLSAIPASYCRRMRILFSSKDNALPIVQFLCGGYTRLGQGADEFMENILQKAELQNNKTMNSSELSNFNHKYHPESETEEDEITNLEQSENRKTFEWIDYAIVDHGCLGHSIPFRLIANLWREDRPGEGLALVNGEHGSYNRFTRFSAWFFGVPDHVGAIGKCQRLVAVRQ